MALPNNRLLPNEMYELGIHPVFWNRASFILLSALLCILLSRTHVQQATAATYIR